MFPLFPILTFERTTVLVVALGILYESILSCALVEFLTAGSSSSTSRLQIDVRTGRDKLAIVFELICPYCN